MPDQNSSPTDETPEIDAQTQETDAAAEPVITCVVSEKKVVLDLGRFGKQTYSIRQLNGTKKANYINKLTKNRIVEGGMVVGFKDHKLLESELIAMCLFDEAGRPVPQQIIDGWNGEALEQLARLCSEYSGLSKKGTEEAKNS